ncbi:FtsW/RodA/SpoVE family cell cycle protein [Flindersiella endophytica]
MTTTAGDSTLDSERQPDQPDGSDGPDELDDALDEELDPQPQQSWLTTLRQTLDRPLTSYHLLIGVGGLLLSLGLVMVASASSVFSFQESGDSFAIFKKQLIWVLAGLPLGFAASRLPSRLLRTLAYPLLLGSVVLLVLTYTPLGREVNGNRNWLDLGGPFMLQPSEMAKLALALWGADLLARKEKLLDQSKHLLIPFVPICGAVLALVLGQGDLGTALVLFSMVLVFLFVVGMPLRFFGIFVGGVGAIVSLLAVTEGYRLDRLTNFLDPFSDYHGTGWQGVHSLFALGTGGWWGVGVGASRQKWDYLPEAHTDFIYAVIGEELGLFGTLAVLALFLILAFVGIRIAMRAPDLFTRLGASAIVGWLITQAMVNMGAVLGLLPITGIPLPLVSYGGSAMLPTLFALGVLVSFARSEPAARAALTAKAEAKAERRRAAREAREARLAADDKE